MARKFLYIVAGLVVAVVLGLLALRFWANDLTRLTFVPTVPFEAQAPMARNAYDDPALWFSRGGLPAGNPAQWSPQGLVEDADALGAAVFFIHPTSYLARDHWNAPLDDAESQDTGRRFIRAMASPFNRNPDLWAPRYRQAAFGAFLTDAPQASQALEVAYGDVRTAFDAFLAATPADRPIVLAGHSQGAFHLKRLLKERVAGTPLAPRLAAVYAVGWPISIAHDLPAMGLEACTAPDQSGCLMSWLSYAEPADPAIVVEAYGSRPALDGKLPAASPFVCTNPLTGKTGGSAPASANLGTLVPDSKKPDSARLVPAMVPARCGEDGFLYIGDGPDLGPYVLPGNNYHVYDIALFWANVRADVSRRVRAWNAAR